MEIGNIKTIPSLVTRDIMVWENIIKEKERNSFATIMVCFSMTWTSTTLCKLEGSMFSPDTALQNSRGSGRQTKELSPTGKEVKDLNAFVKNKIKETIKEQDCARHAMSNFKNSSIPLSDKSIQSIIINASVEVSDNDSCKPAHKK
eukprot:9080546-Ditylum_brightwellii.AAC.1